MAQQYADATVSQIGVANKSYVDQTRAQGGGWDLYFGSGTDATIKVLGNSNQTSIVQVGKKNVAGQDIRLDWFSACSGFGASNVGHAGVGSLTINTCDIQLACCHVIDGGSYTLDFDQIFPGIYVTGDDNIASISQKGNYLLAGITIDGSDNKAGISQHGSNNVATLKIDGNDNHSVIKQHNELNAAFVQVTGNDNKTGVFQKGYGNVVGQKVDGNNNNVYASQSGLFGSSFGGLNEAIQNVDGDNNNVLLTQQGMMNSSVQETTGSQNNSWVTQKGMFNQSVVKQ